MKRKPYDFHRERDYAAWARSHFPDIRGAAFHALYFVLPELERRTGVGFGGRVAATWDAWAAESGDDRRTIAHGLEDLAIRGLIAMTKGNAKERKSTLVKRHSIEEVERRTAASSLHKYIPENIEALARKLEERGTWWGGNLEHPKYTVKDTGRIVTSAPCFHNRKPDERNRRLVENLRDGETLVECDFKQAEPSVILSALSRRRLLESTRSPSDIYQDLASIRSVPREEAKRDILALFYSPYQRVTVPTDWSIPGDHFLRGLIAAVDELRQILWQDGRSSGKERRHVLTLNGRKMVVPRGRRTHRGLLLSWLAQGTIADLMTGVVESLLDREAASDLRFFLSVYDSCYVATLHGEQGARQVSTIMESVARSHGLTIEAETALHPFMVHSCTEQQRRPPVQRSTPIPLCVSGVSHPASLRCGSVSGAFSEDTRGNSSSGGMTK